MAQHTSFVLYTSSGQVLVLTDTEVYMVVPLLSILYTVDTPTTIGCLPAPRSPVLYRQRIYSVVFCGLETIPEGCLRGRLASPALPAGRGGGPGGACPGLGDKSELYAGLVVCCAETTGTS